MSGIGSVLKEARTKKEITLEDVHSKLKIHPRVLQLLEEEKFDKLPSPLFAKSFLKSYAQFLEVDVAGLIENYEKERKGPEPEQKLYLRPVDMNPPRRIQPTWWMGAAALGLLAALMLVSSSKPLGVWASKFKEQRPRAAAKVKAVKIVEVPAVQQEPKQEVKQADEWLNSVKLGNFPKIAKKTALSLQVKALEAVWVHVTCDEKVLFQGVIKKGASETLSAKETIEVWTGNASSMALSLNKTSLGSPGKGVVKKMVLSHEGIRIASPDAA